MLAAMFHLLYPSLQRRVSHYARKALHKTIVMQQAQLFETADERGCTPMFGASHRRESARFGVQALACSDSVQPEG